MDQNIEKLLKEFRILLDFLSKNNYYAIQRFPLREYSNNSFLLLNELGNLKRYLTLRNNIFSISIKPSFYSSIYPDSFLLFLRDFFFLNKKFHNNNRAWEEFIPQDLISRLITKKLLRKHDSINWYFSYRIVPYYDKLFITSRYDRKENNFTFLSFDSLYFASFLTQRLNAISFSSHRSLDLCCGIGIQSFMVSPFSKSVIGVDINPFAVQLSKINSVLNNYKNCIFQQSSMFNELSGLFDLIVANPPFVFYNGSDNENIDSAGGKPYGLGYTLKIIKQLSIFLRKNGKAFILTRTPIFYDGDYLLKILPDYLTDDFGWIFHYISDSVSPLDSFEIKIGIKGYRNIILEIFRSNFRIVHKYSLWHRRTALF